MQNKKEIVIIIPSRIGSTRLKEKALSLIGKKYNMIQLVALQAAKTGYPVIVATDSEKIAASIKDINIDYIMTDSSCDSGTDRVYQAFKQLKKNSPEIKYVINLQGDMPFIKDSTIVQVANTIQKPSLFPIITAVAPISRDIALSNSNVKVVIDSNNKALYFSRSIIPHFAENFLYHIGIYAFKSEILERFVNLPSSNLEKDENLEQLRALENGIDIGVCFVEDIPISVDTVEDLAKARAFLEI